MALAKHTRESSLLNEIPKPKSESKPKKERKPARKISIDSDSSVEDIPIPDQKNESVFLKSLSALRDHNLTPADDESVHQAGRLLTSMGLDSDSDQGKI